MRQRQSQIPPQQNFHQSYPLAPHPHQQQPPQLQQQQPKQTKRKPPPDSLEASTAKRRTSDIPQLSNIAPRPIPGSPGQQSSTSAAPKKRGRPSKATVARRDAEAIARGEVIAPIRTSSLRPDTPGARERTGTPIYQAIAPMMSPRMPMPSPLTPGGYGMQSFEASDANSPGKQNRPTQRNVSDAAFVDSRGTNLCSQPHEGQTTFSAARPESSSSSRAERSTYPNIIGSLTDTIPANYGPSSAPAPQTSTQNIQILHPPVSSYGHAAIKPPTAAPQRRPSQ